MITIEPAIGLNRQNKQCARSKGSRTVLLALMKAFGFTFYWKITVLKDAATLAEHGQRELNRLDLNLEFSRSLEANEE